MLEVVSTQRLFNAQCPVLGRQDRKSYIDCTIFKDSVTGVHYMFCQSQGQNGNGLTVMVDGDGKPLLNYR